jgi:hypothetical protein
MILSGIDEEQKMLQSFIKTVGESWIVTPH